MRTISNDFKSLLYTSDRRDYIETVYITLQDGTDLVLTNSNLWDGGIYIDEATSSDNSLDIGSAIINECRINIENINGQYNSVIFEKAKIVPHIGLLINNEVEDIKMGEYYVDDASYNGLIITLTAYDNMTKFDKLISYSNMHYPATLNSIIEDACTVCNVPYHSPISIPHGNYSVKEKPEPTQTTFRELLAWAGQISGVCFRIDSDGYLKSIWYDSDGLNQIINGGSVPSTAHTFTSSFGSPIVSLNDIIVTQIAVSEEVFDETENKKKIERYVVGSSGYTISIEGNKLVQDNKGREIATWLQQDLYGFRYRKASLSIQSDPSIQAGDIAKIFDIKGHSYAIIISHTTFHVGNRQTIVSSGADPEKTGIQRTSQQTKNYVSMLESIAEERAARKDAETTIIDSIDAHTARIEYLEADASDFNILSADYAVFKEATADNFTATNAAINELRVYDLAAISANITTLQSGYANISTLLSGNAGVGSLQAITLTAQNSNISTSFSDKLFANYATIQNLVTGNINTDNVTISSTDGSLLINGSVQQFKDDNNIVRLQLGKDANNDYSFAIFDENGNAIWYNNGITANGIPNGIIVNNMISPVSNNYSGIGADKLNISSVKGAIEQGGFSSSLIYFDDTSQTLNQIYSQITSSIDSTNDLALQAKNEANTATSGLIAVREMISGIDTLEGMVITLTNEAHVVHTYNDGTGGDYSDANTQVMVYVGDTDVTTQALIECVPSNTVTGTWNNTTKVYQITGLSGMDGYVDFFSTYGARLNFLTSRSGNVYTTRSGKKLKLNTGAAHLQKRFSISKSPDGQVGTSYKLLASVLAIQRNNANVLTPSSVTFSAIKTNGNVTTDFNGYFKIETSNDGILYNTVYVSQKAETTKSYSPVDPSIKSIRCLISDSQTGENTLDTISVVVIADADEIQSDVENIRQKTQTLNTKYGEVSTGIDGLRVSLGQTQSDLVGLTNGSLLYQTPYTWSDDHQTAYFSAVVYQAGNDITDTMPSAWFSWYIRTEDGERLLEHGKTCIVNKSQLGYGGTVIGRLVTYSNKYLTTRSGKYLATRSGYKLKTYTSQ